MFASAERALVSDASADTVEALRAPAALSFEPSAKADWAADWRAPGLLASELKADAFCAIRPDATCRLCSDALSAARALNALALAASAEKAPGFAPSADMAFESAARLANAEAAPAMAGIFAALAASLLNAAKLLPYFPNAAAFAAIAEKAAGWVASAEKPDALVASAANAPGLDASFEKAGEFCAIALSAEACPAESCELTDKAEAC